MKGNLQHGEHGEQFRFFRVFSVVMRKNPKPRRGDRDSFAPLGLVSISTADPGAPGLPRPYALGYFCSAPLGAFGFFLTTRAFVVKILKPNKVRTNDAD